MIENKESGVQKVEEVDPTDSNTLREIFTFIEKNDLIEHELDPTKKKEIKNLDSIVEKCIQDFDPESNYIVEVKNAYGKIVAVGIARKISNWGELDTLVVDKEYRGKGLGTLLTHKRVEILKREGCTEVRTDVSINNIPSLGTKFKEGFVIRGTSNFNLAKNSDVVMWKHVNEDDAEKKYEGFSNIVEVPMNDHQTIQDLLKSGAIGVDIKNVYEDPEEVTYVADSEDINPMHWKMIFRKK